MDSTAGRRNPPLPPGPQLARKCYNNKILPGPAPATKVTGLTISKKSNANGMLLAVSSSLPLSDDDSTNDSDNDLDDDFFSTRSKPIFQSSKRQQQQANEGPKQCTKRQKRTEQKERDKQERLRTRTEQKEREKQERLRKRREANEEKELQKQKAKITKKRQNEEHNQVTGKYRHEEIAVLLDTELYTGDAHGLKTTLSEDFFVYRYPSRLVTPAKTIQFIRKDKLLGGARDAVLCLEADRARGTSNGGDDPGYERIQYLVVLFEPDDFIPLLCRDDHEEEDDYPKLESWLDALRARLQLQRASPSSSGEPKIVFLLYELPDVLDKKWLEYRRNNRNASRNEASLPTVKELQDAMLWLLVQFQVECILCPTTEFLQSTVHKMTRGLSDIPYTNQVTELECIKKIKQRCVGSDDPIEKAKDVWIRQLQQIPGLSETRAQHVAEHFPTCQSLWQAYQWEYHHQTYEDNNHDADAACSSLLEDKFSADNRLYKKLSDTVYRVLTSDDPNKMIL
eukprot:jgi/Psemu1/327813/estExt_fgenesh1_pg.C_8330009